jgi:hypothetical protein
MDAATEVAADTDEGVDVMVGSTVSAGPAWEL